MAWNWDKGCEEPMPYQHGNPTGVYTPPTWNPQLLKYVLHWEKCEANLKVCSRWASPATQQAHEDNAIRAWKVLESKMLWDDNAKIPEFRRKYMEWLAKEQNMSSNIGFSDVTDDQLPLLERIIAAGFRQLAKSEHPDLGGTDERFRNLKEAKTQLDAILAEVKDVL